MTIENIIARGAADAVKALYGAEVDAKTLNPSATKKEFEGDLTVVVFPVLKMSRKSPEATANEIGEWMVANVPAVEKFNAVKGFLNLSISKGFWLDLLHEIAEDDNFGIKRADTDSPLVMVEYSSPNTNKPLHLGHVRNNLLGYSLACILEADGNRVVKTNIVNDRGIHICKSMLAWLKWGEGVTPETAGKKGDHLIGDFYVAFDKHYKDEVKALKKQLTDQGVPEEEAETRAKEEAPLMQEAREMLRKLSLIHISEPTRP